MGEDDHWALLETEAKSRLLEKNKCTHNMRRHRKRSEKSLAARATHALIFWSPLPSIQETANRSVSSTTVTTR